MAEKNSKLTSNVKANATAINVTPSGAHSNRPRIVQNYLLVWLDVNATTSSQDSHHTLEQLRTTVNDVNTFIEPEQCLTFLQDIQLEKVFLIVSGSLGRDLVPRIHPLTQVDAIFIFCGDTSRHEGWVRKWPKVKGLHTHIKPICAALELAVKQCNQDSTPLSFAQVSEDDTGEINLNQLEPSFMYTQLFKKTLLDMEHDRKTAVRDLVKYCQQTYVGNPAQLALIDEFRRSYQQERTIWWYTREGFTYQMLNRALRLLEADIIVNMSFFIHDLHQQIQQLHKEQLPGYRGRPFVVYRGQGLSTGDFEKLKRSRGGLMSFNCFVSTSTKKDKPMEFARNAAMDPDRVGILFVMTIDPNISGAPFADIKEVSYFQDEAEILFSMHTVFRIDTIKQMDKKGGHVQVNLILTVDQDTQLNDLMKQLDGDVGSSSGWERMGRLLLKVGQPEKAEELYHTLLEQTTDRGDQGRFYHQLGCIKDAQGDYPEAVSFYERALEIKEKSLPANHPSLATSYNNIGTVYDNMGEYSKALSFYERALEIRQKSLPANHPDLATSYNNIGTVYDNMGEYSKALSFYERALEIRQKSLPANHPSLATSYNNIGTVYDNMGEYSKALSFYERALEIRQKSLPANHPDLATSYNNIGTVYYNMGEYSKALSSLERALEIKEKTLPANHPSLATSYNNIGGVYKNMGEYSKALSFYERALEILKKSLPANHPSLATSYNNIGTVYDNMGEYSKALSFYERALEIRQKSLPANHPDLATSYNNIGTVYYNMGEYSKALSSLERALEIKEKTLPANHPSLATSYNNIGGVYKNMGEYSKALSFYERALEIRQKSLPANHPDLATSYNNIGGVYDNMGEYSKALSFYERALEIWKKSLPANHPSLATSYNNIGLVYDNMGEYAKALSFYERALEIRQKSLPASHPQLGSVRESIEIVKAKLNKK